jgi:16S rRNA (cytosine967-C5)-methyltransferase
MGLQISVIDFTLQCLNRTMLLAAAEVIASVSVENPADQALRKIFAADRPSPEGRRAVTDAVFAYFRWHGWLTRTSSVTRQIQQALDLDAEFSATPEKFTEQELAPRAVPGWTRGHMERPLAWLREIQTHPKLWLRARPGKAAELAESLGDCAPGPLPDSLEYAGAQDLFLTAQFKAGEFEIQDIASQAVSQICAPREKETWWDACAGEGGKTLHLSDLMRNTGLIWSSDRADWRLAQLKKRTARAGVFNYRAKLWDGSEHLPTKTMFDGILMDAPCSGIGTWGRNPHARWTTTVDDVNELAQIQLQLLINATALLKSGGKIYYAVCTLARRETVEVAEKFTKIFPQLRPHPIAFAPLQTKAKPTLTIWPQDLHGNGMFVAAWTRIA